MGAIRGLWGDPWCIGGDFNIIRFPNERNREGKLLGYMRRFSQVLDDLELKDLPLQGGLFNWKGGPSNTRMARLDRFIVTEEWDSFFGGARLGGGGGGGGGREWWQGSMFKGSKSYCLSEKLKALKGNLRGWNKDVFGLGRAEWG